MKETSNKKLVKIVVSAMFAALTCVATMVIRIPTFGTNGYVNIGDSVVLLCAWLIGGVYGALAAGIGSGLADLLAGYAQYVPGTFIIKFAMAYVAYLIFTSFAKKEKFKIFGFTISAIVAEIIMVFGYFAFESTLLGYGLAAAGSIGSNAVQGVTCLVLGLAAVTALDKTGARDKMLLRID
ncbi:MAG: ECF transporter S component [Oscillospiraceae bacterium]|nr:ECF transporter S component [Oscillospiraceae bacterium]